MCVCSMCVCVCVCVCVYVCVFLFLCVFWCARKRAQTCYEVVQSPASPRPQDVPSLPENTGSHMCSHQPSAGPGFGGVGVGEDRGTRKEGGRVRGREGGRKREREREHRSDRKRDRVHTREREREGRGGVGSGGAVQEREIDSVRSKRALEGEGEGVEGKRSMGGKRGREM